MPAKKTARKVAAAPKKAVTKKSKPQNAGVKATAPKKTVKAAKRPQTLLAVPATIQEIEGPETHALLAATPAPVQLPPPNLPPDEPKEKRQKEIPTAIFGQEQVIADNSDAARDLYAQSRFGAMLEDGKLQLSLIEALYLLERGKLVISDLRGVTYGFQRFIKRAKAIEPNFWVRYSVFKDMRNRGYIVKTALKFGADFRVYDRGIKPGEDHARWVLYPIHEGSTLTWHEFAAKARVAHSTKKRLLLGIVDDEGDVTYYEIKWMRP